MLPKLQKKLKIKHGKCALKIFSQNSFEKYMLAPKANVFWRSVLLWIFSGEGGAGASRWIGPLHLVTDPTYLPPENTKY